MNFAHVHIKNLRSIEELELNLTAPDWLPRRRRVLLGGNGSGKTTTLLAIAYLLGQADSDFDAKRMGAGDVRQRSGGQSAPLPVRSNIEIQVRLSQEDRALWAQYAPKKEPPEHGTLQSSIGGLPRDAELQHMLLGKPLSFYEFAPLFGHVDPGMLIQTKHRHGAEPELADLASEGVIRTIIARRRHPPGVLLPADRSTHAGAPVRPPAPPPGSPRPPPAASSPPLLEPTLTQQSCFPLTGSGIHAQL